MVGCVIDRRKREKWYLVCSRSGPESDFGSQYTELIFPQRSVCSAFVLFRCLFFLGSIYMITLTTRDICRRFSQRRLTHEAYTSAHDLCAGEQLQIFPTDLSNRKLFCRACVKCSFNSAGSCEIFFLQCTSVD